MKKILKNSVYYYYYTILFRENSHYQWSLQFFRDPLMIQTRAMMVENNPGSVTYFNNRDRSRKHCLTRVRVHRDEPGREHGWINHGVTIHAEGVS